MTATSVTTAAPPETVTQAIQTEEVVLRVTGLTKRYGQRTVVDNLDLTVRRGEVFGFLGPNGAGKTTAMAMILGLVQPHAGQIDILGHDPRTDQRATLRQVGALVETPTFYPYLSGSDNLRLLALAHGGVPAQHLREVITRVGLQGRERDRFGTYSLGMKQRLGIASTLLHQPDLLILDEPSNGLDPAGIVEIRELLLHLAQQGQTILLCSHLLAEVQQVCDRVLILNKGRAIMQGDVTELLNQGAQTILRTDDPTRTALVLGNVPWISGIDRDGDRLLLTMPPEQQFTLGQILNEHSLIIGELRRQERDLEGLFLALTGEEAA